VPNPSLSVVLPVYNAEQTIANKVAELLDILPDLTSKFEILIVNNGSTDHTEEVAYELARTYPQVRITRHDAHRGHPGAVETGLNQTSGDIMFVQDENAPIDSSKLHRLWELRNEDDLVFARPEFRVKRSLLQRLAAWGVRLEEATQGGEAAGVQMIRRQSLARLNELDAIDPDTSAARHSRTDKRNVRHDTQSRPNFNAIERPRTLSPKSGS
jgi:glycosyltransferase involved in cell wall biosynthesis